MSSHWIYPTHVPTAQSFRPNILTSFIPETSLSCLQDPKLSLSTLKLPSGFLKHVLCPLRDSTQTVPSLHGTHTSPKCPFLHTSSWDTSHKPAPTHPHQSSRCHFSIPPGRTLPPRYPSQLSRLSPPPLRASSECQEGACHPKRQLAHPTLTAGIWLGSGYEAFVFTQTPTHPRSQRAPSPRAPDSRRSGSPPPARARPSPSGLPPARSARARFLWPARARVPPRGPGDPAAGPSPSPPAPSRPSRRPLLQDGDGGGGGGGG